MPPSPALRCSPGRELRVDKHKRGNSLESGLLFKDKDDDLALFNEVQTREKDNFLLESSDDIEDAFSTKLKYFSEYKLGINIPGRGESSDLLNADGDKNDYDWLLTPPDTPLFPSLDDDPAPVSVAPRGRPRSQPISISRSSTMEKSYRSSRGSPSPNRLSPSPRTANNTLQPRGRPSSASSSSPTPSQRRASPSRRPSPPPSKPIAPTRRSITPTPRRLSTGSAGARGISPVKTSRGNSASPKIRAWQSNFPGFSSEAPPNLRTSLVDRPASYVRGSSPASRNSRDSTSKYSRPSSSPTPSRSASSSHSHDRDRFSSHSKGSIVSSGDDDGDSLHSIPVGSLDCLNSRRGGVIPNNRSPILSKKPARIFSPSSAPKRSFDSTLKLMDQRKSPPNMFRPLLSSVPSTTFYAGKASSAHRSLISRNSSFTTSSNASSDQCRSNVLDTEGSDHNQDDFGSEYGKVQDPDIHEEVFPFEKGDEVNEDAKHIHHNASVEVHHGNFVRSLTMESYRGGSQEPIHQGTIIEVNVSPEELHTRVDALEVDLPENMEICSQCGCQYQVSSPVEGDIKLCPECESKKEELAVPLPETKIGICESSSLPSVKTLEGHKHFVEPGSSLTVSLLPRATERCEPTVSHGEDNILNDKASCDKHNHEQSRGNLCGTMLGKENDQRTAGQQAMGHPSADFTVPDNHIKDQQLQHENGLSNYASGGAGISLLLRRSNSSKGNIVQGRPFSATSISYDDMSYSRESASSSRSSLGPSSFSVPSSVDFTLVRQTESRLQRQLSSQKSDMDKYKYDVNTKPQSCGSSLSGMSSHSHSLGLQTSTHEENLEVGAYGIDSSTVENSGVAPHNHVLLSEGAELEKREESIPQSNIVEEDKYDCNWSKLTTDAITSELSCHTCTAPLDDYTRQSVSNNEECVLFEGDEDSSRNAKSGLEETSSGTLESSTVGEHAASSTVDGVDLSMFHDGSVAATTEIQVEDCHQSTSNSLVDADSQPPKGLVDESPETNIPTSSDKELTTVSDPHKTDHSHDISEESTVLLEGHGRSKTRSLTLEEATDTILFCSSIVHDMAYQAATMAMEKENLEGREEEPLEGSRPTITVVEKPSSDRKEPRRNSGRRASKSLKPKQQRPETDSNPSSLKTENDENAGESLTQNAGLPNKVDSMKPPKLESKCNCTIM